MRSTLDRPLTQSITGLFWAVALLVLGYLDVAAQSRIGFPANQFGQAELALPQSRTATELETLFNAHADNFELVKAFSDDHPIKRLSKSIGRLDLLVNGREGGQWVEVCTGTLIDEDHVLTAHHCFLSGDGVPLNIAAARFRLGYYGGPDGEGRDFQVQLPPLEERGNEKLDFAILNAVGSPGRGISRAPLSVDIPRAGEELLIIHHPLGKPMRVTRRFCRTPMSGYVTLSDFRHRCDTLGGSSGAPVFTDVTRKLIGIHYRGGLDETPESFNSAILLSAIIRNSALLTHLLGPQSPARSGRSASLDNAINGIKATADGLVKESSKGLNWSPNSSRDVNAANSLIEEYNQLIMRAKSLFENYEYVRLLEPVNKERFPDVAASRVKRVAEEISVYIESFDERRALEKTVINLIKRGDEGEKWLSSSGRDVNAGSSLVREFNYLIRRVKILFETNSSIKDFEEINEQLDPSAAAGRVKRSATELARTLTSL